jgi:CheY-like chemotaxis protein
VLAAPIPREFIVAGCAYSNTWPHIPRKGGAPEPNLVGEDLQSATVRPLHPVETAWIWPPRHTGLEMPVAKVKCDALPKNPSSEELDIPKIGDVGNFNIAQTIVVIARRKYPQGNPRILLADDEPVISELFARKLRSAGYAVTEAPSGAEALYLLRGIPFQLLVLNLDMRVREAGGYDGFEVLKIVRVEFPRVPVLVISGFLEGSLLKAAEVLGAKMTLEKTSAPWLLVESARKLIGER